MWRILKNVLGLNLKFSWSTENVIIALPIAFFVWASLVTTVGRCTNLVYLHVYVWGWDGAVMRLEWRWWLFWSAFTDDGAPIALVIIYILWVFLMRLFVIKRLMCKISVFIFNLKSLTQSLTGSFSTNELDSWEPKIPHSSAQCRKKSLTSSLSLCVSIF
jgi:hypothetical protein